MKTACAAIFLALVSFPALGQNVKITPVGSHPGELCANDRAMIFEDPTGVRFLYDPAHNMTGGDDPRLGTIHLVLLSHMQRDHVNQLKPATHLAISGRTMEFDGKATCVAGC